MEKPTRLAKLLKYFILIHSGVFVTTYCDSVQKSNYLHRPSLRADTFAKLMLSPLACICPQYKLPKIIFCTS